MKSLRLIITGILMVATCFFVQAQQEDYGKKDDKPRRSQEQETFDYNSDPKTKKDGTPKKWDWSKARIGGNFGASFSFGDNGAIYLDISPTFGYRINEVLELGGGFKNIYSKYSNVAVVDQNGIILGYTSFKDYVYGPVGYGRFHIWKGIMAMAQYEMVNKKSYFYNSDGSLDRVNVHHLLIGGGYSQSIGNAGQLNIALLYNVIDSNESIYQYGTFGDVPLFLNISVGFGLQGRR